MNYKALIDKYDFCDSIICGIHWDNNMRNVNISIDYYFAQSKNKKITIRILECTNVIYQLRERNLDDIWSNLTIFSLNIREIDQNKVAIEFYGMADCPFLVVTGSAIEIEDD